MKDRKDYRDYRYISYDNLLSTGLAVRRDNYNCGYAAPLVKTGITEEQLETIYERFNVNHPKDFNRRSSSSSDIIDLKQDGVISCQR